MMMIKTRKRKTKLVDDDDDDDVILMLCARFGQGCWLRHILIVAYQKIYIIKAWNGKWFFLPLPLFFFSHNFFLFFSNVNVSTLFRFLSPSALESISICMNKLVACGRCLAISLKERATWTSLPIHAVWMLYLYMISTSTWTKCYIFSSFQVTNNFILHSVISSIDVCETPFIENNMFLKDPIQQIFLICILSKLSPFPFFLETSV